MGSCEKDANFVGGEKKLEEMVKGIEKELWVPIDLLKKLANEIELMMQKGLKDESSSSIKMLVSYVDYLPSGNEEGCFYALDLGGTNLRAMRVKLQGNKTIELNADSYMVPSSIKVGKLHELFDYIADKVALLFEKEGNSKSETLGRRKEVGFTFSFPVHQTKINSGTLLNWTKDFNVNDAIGKDMVEELIKALKRRAIDVNVTALLNDTVGTLAGGRFYNNNVVASVILGTGMNAAYVEKSENILKPYGSPPKSGQMVINTEWGNFNSSHLPLTEYDRALDNDSPNRGKQVLEKMLSGRYLGEIVRRILVRLAEDAALFGDIVPPKLKKQYALGTDVVSTMHGDKSADLSVVGKCLDEVLGITNLSLEKKKVVVKICELAATRGARLSAAGILAILKRLGKDTPKKSETVIAIDGSLYGKYEEFKLCLEKTLSQELLDKEVSKMVVLKQFKDASGIGAAVVAASHSIYTI